MTRQEMISTALAGITLLSRSIDAANNGDEETARANLEAVRGHFSSWLDRWESTRPGSAAPDSGGRGA